MSIIVVEKNRSGILDDAGVAEKTYDIYGTDSSPDALAALRAAAPTTYQGVARTRCRVEPAWVNSLVEAGHLLGSAEYNEEDEESEKCKALPPLEIGEERETLNTMGGTRHMTQGLQMSSSPDVFERRYPAPGKQYRDYRGAIRVTRNGVEGCEVPFGVYLLEVTKVFTDAEMTQAFKVQIADLTPTVNEDAFRGFPAGEVCFLGWRGGQRADTGWEMTLGFHREKNVTNKKIGEITVATKLGWEYLWVEYEEYYHSSQKLTAKRPAVAYIDKVLEYGDLSLLGISTGA